MSLDAGNIHHYLATSEHEEGRRQVRDERDRPTVVVVVVTPLPVAGQSNSQTQAAVKPAPLCVYVYVCVPAWCAGVHGRGPGPS